MSARITQSYSLFAFGPHLTQSLSAGASWFLDDVEVVDSYTGVSYKFSFNNWLKQDAKNPAAAVTLRDPAITRPKPRSSVDGTVSSMARSSVSSQAGLPPVQADGVTPPC